MGLGWRATLFSVGVMGPWALAHWEEYHSGAISGKTSRRNPEEICYFFKTTIYFFHQLQSSPLKAKASCDDKAKTLPG